MRAVIQRVLSASVVVEGREVSRIGKGLMCLIGISTQDTPSDMDYITKKILNLKLFPDQVDDEILCKQWAKSVMDVQGEVLCATRKGSKPDFHAAMGSEQSKQFYASFLGGMGEQYQPDRIKDGEFGAMMQVALTNEGPVTVIVDSNDSRSDRSSGTTTESGASTPEVQAAQRAAQLEAKQRKREENERRQRENAEKRAARSSKE